MGPMTNQERRAVLERVIRESEALREAAGRADFGFIAFMLANVSNDARATLSKLSSEILRGPHR